MWKKILMFGVPIVIIMIIISLYLSTTSSPVIKDIHNGRVVKIEYNPDFEEKNGELKEQLEYDEIAVLKCLSKYNEKNSYARHKGVHRGECQFIIYVDDGTQLKSIYLGNDDFSCYEYGSFKHNIINSENLKKELKAIIKGEN